MGLDLGLQFDVATASIRGDIYDWAAEGNSGVRTDIYLKPTMQLYSDLADKFNLDDNVKSKIIDGVNELRTSDDVSNLYSDRFIANAVLEDGYYSKAANWGKSMAYELAYVKLKAISEGDQETVDALGKFAAQASYEHGKDALKDNSVESMEAYQEKVGLVGVKENPNDDNEGLVFASVVSTLKAIDNPENGYSKIDKDYDTEQLSILAGDAANEHAMQISDLINIQRYVLDPNADEQLQRQVDRYKDYSGSDHILKSIDDYKSLIESQGVSTTANPDEELAHQQTVENNITTMPPS